MNWDYFQAERSRRVLLEEEKALSCILCSHDPVIEQRDYSARLLYINLGNLLSHHCRCKMKEVQWPLNSNRIKAPSSNSHCKYPHCYPTW